MAPRPIIHVVASDPRGQAHFTALGIRIAVEAVLVTQEGGIRFPETAMTAHRPHRLAVSRSRCCAARRSGQASTRV